MTNRWDLMNVWFRYHPEREPWAVLVYSHGTPVAAALLSRGRRAGVWFISRPGEGDMRVSLPAASDVAARILADGIADAI